MVEVVVAVVFFGGLIALLLVVVSQGRKSATKQPILTIPLPKGELQVFVQDDGWAEWATVVDGEIVSVEECGISDEEAVGILEGAGLSPAEAQEQIVVIERALEDG
jgi:hypothetical protein